MSLVRWYSVLAITIGLYLLAYILLGNYPSLLIFLKDVELHLTILSVDLAIMGGFIINTYYDIEKDIINKPREAAIHRMLNREFSLRTYLVLNLLSVAAAYFVSWPILAYVSGLIFMLWFYSHKLRKKKFLSEISATILTLSPFFAIVLYFQKITTISLLYLGYVFMLVLTREITKKLTTIKGDAVYGDQSLPLTLGVAATKGIISGLILFTILPIVFLFPLYQKESLAMYYFAGVCTVLGFSLVLMFVSNETKAYKLINNVLKALIVSAILAVLMLK